MYVPPSLTLSYGKMESRRQGSPPSKLARLSDNDHGQGLGLDGRGKSAFTFMQLQELEHQALIFQHMAAGLPVPLHLVLPIWKSVAGSSPFAPHHSFPSLLGYSSFDGGGGVDSEPGRCRRTDGKKWRCSKPVVPNQKYCERHMHRGRHRSRKIGGEAAGEPSPAPNPPAAEAMADGAAYRSGAGDSTSPARLGFSPISVLPDGAEDGSS